MTSKVFAKTENKTPEVSASSFQEETSSLSDQTFASLRQVNLPSHAPRCSIEKLDLYNKDRIASCPVGVQTKLMINQPGDMFEQEADAMAEKVVRIADSSQDKNISFKAPIMQRKIGVVNTEQKKEHIHRKESQPGMMQAGNRLINYVSNLNNSGMALSSEARNFFEPRFGIDFGSVRIHTDSNAARSAQSIHARAYTYGNNIVFNNGEYSIGSYNGKRLLGHELTHFIQQKNNSFPKVINRFQIEGPWDINDPVHENITLYGLIDAGLVPPGTKFNADEVWEYMRGAMWNDDPEGLLFDNNEKENKNWSSGIEWKGHFDEGGKKAKAGKPIGQGDTLTARSHYGDLQFIHGMASKDGEKASETKGKIMMWAEFTYKVSIGEIAENTTLDNIPVSGIPAIFKGTAQEKQTVRSLFHVNKTGSTQKRAIGSLLHIIQDSYAEGHTQRASTGGNSRGEVESFHSYTNQDEEKHGDKDAFPAEKKGESTRDRIARIPGGSDAILNCAVILIFFKNKQPWNIAKYFLDTTIFKLADPNNLSGPGTAFAKKKTKK
jgi:hypothetical protein